MGMIRIKKDVVESWLKNKSTPPQTIEELADAIKVSQSLLSLIWSDKRQITPNVLRKLCELTGYDVGDLCFYDKNKEPDENET
jgi:transcriptional regulator with XRE-family HTH domain